VAATGDLEVRLRSARLRARLSQGELAGRAGITRQAISAIEGGKAVPTTAVALRLARALGVRIEELFRLVDELPRVQAELLPAAEPLPAGPLRVQVAQVGERVLARPLSGASGVALGLTRANGLVRVARGAGPAEVDLFGDPERLGRTVVAVGCDPAAALLADHLRERYPSFDVAWQGGGSTAALEAVARGEAHLAGCHLLDPASGEYNLPFVRALFGEQADVVTFAVWEQGFIVAAGNPRGVGSVGDLARPDLRFVNREAGTGARALLDSQLAAAGLSPSQVPGYGRIVSSHLAVAEAIAAGLADVGIGVRAAAQALGLGFLPLAEERYDLVIPHQFFELAPLQALLETLYSPLFRLEVEALGGYDVRPMGTHVAAA
jgi:molybdopterin molybdotransferase/putative molybdopterin biosynthesis protein